MNSNVFKISIGIPAYNEEANIEHLLNALKNQKLNKVQITEIIVIASGCTDNTVKIVNKFKSPVRLITEKERSGKSSAVNLFINAAKEDILVLESADTIPAPETIEALCLPFIDSSFSDGHQAVGLTGAHPVPTNDHMNFIGFCVKTMWDIHHQIAMQKPKCGELIAFRKDLPDSANNFRTIITGIPDKSAVDEASIEAEIRKHNLKIVYVKDAIVYNKGPETIKEFISQRRRISSAHFWLRKNHTHKPSTASKRTALLYTIQRFTWNPKNNIQLIGMMMMEIYAKILGRYDYYIKKNDHRIWQRIETSKNPQL